MTTGLVHDWPEEIAQLLASITPNPQPPDSYFAIADVTLDELTAVALLGVAARNGRVRFPVPGSASPLVGTMNPIVGLGSSSKAAKVRISFHDVSAE